MNRTINIVISILFVSLLILYVYPNSPEFPKMLPDTIQSFEPADVETTLRRGYYTNLTRSEVITHYENEFNKDFIFLGKNIKFLAPRLNYPPEEAQTIIRDQTKSTFLEEIVHPFRESIYINGFEPKTEEYVPVIDGVRWRQKVIVRYVPSDRNLRIILSILTGASLFLILESFRFRNENKRWKKMK